MVLDRVRGRMARIGLILPLLVCVGNLQAEIAVSPEMVALIRTAAAKSYAVYPIDKEKHAEMLGLVDQWAQSKVPLDDRHRIKDRSSDRITWVKEQAENAPIFPAGENGRGLSPTGSFRIKYVKKPEGRSFVKSIRMPTVHRLKEEEVAAIGRAFVEKQGFVAQTSVDKIGGHMVASRLTDGIQANDVKTKTLTVLQRAIFKRSLDGLEVFNSRQIVDVHPDSREILAYKGLEWAPAGGADRKAVSALPADKLLTEIKERFRNTSSLYHVTGIEVGMYQSRVEIFPVLAVDVERAGERKESPILRTHYLPLSEAGSTPQRTRSVKLPQAAH